MMWHRQGIKTRVKAMTTVMCFSPSSASNTFPIPFHSLLLNFLLQNNSISSSFSFNFMKNFRIDFETSRGHPDERSNHFHPQPSDHPLTMGNDEETTQSLCTEWTDEKHSLYLKSMETSFVNQLYDSMGLVQKSVAKQSSSGQFKIHQSGCWQRINFDRAKPRVVEEDQSCGTEILSNPWILHFRPASKKQDLESCSFPEYAAIVSGAVESNGKNNGRSRLCHQDLNAEVSDQNFVDEDIKERKTKGKHDAKRMRTRLSISSHNDQVVPLHKPPL